MKSHLLTVLVLLGLASCHTPTNTTASFYRFIPQNAAIVIRFNNLSQLRSELKNNGVLGSFDQSETYAKFLKKVDIPQFIKTDTVSIMAFVPVAGDSLAFLLTTPYKGDVPRLETLDEKSVNTVVYGSIRLTRHVVDQSVYYSTVEENTLLVSSSGELLASVMDTKNSMETDPALEMLYKAANKESSASIFFNAKNNEPLARYILKNDSLRTLSHFSDWISLDLDSGQDYLALNGMALARYTSRNFINLFKGSMPIISNTPGIAPASADAILSFSINEWSNFAHNQQSYLGDHGIQDSLFRTTEEVGHVYLNGGKAIVVHTYGAEFISQFLLGLKKNAQDYQGSEIIELNDTSFLNDYFDPLIGEFQSRFYTVIENTFVFASDLETVQTIMAYRNRGETFDKSPGFTSVRGALADASNILFVSNSPGMEAIMEAEAEAQLLSDFKSSEPSELTYAAQVVTEDSFYHTHLVIRKNQETFATDTTTPLFTIQLDDELATEPQFVTNHRTDKKEIVVQDQSNNLYLISTAGKVLWKKQLKGRVQGRISQVDIFRNGRLQLAFTTDSEFLILDRNGNEVKPFNRSYSGGNLNPLAVFDYEGNRNYRFVVTQGSKVFMYNNQGNEIRGFTFTDAGSEILAAPAHFRIGNRDYLLFKLENGELKILNREGKTRITVKEHIDFSDNNVMVNGDNFTVTDKKGTLYRIDQKGGITKNAMNLNADHGTDATSKTLVVMNDNELTIKGTKVQLELGVYTKPRIFYLYDKIYVAVTDIQSEQAYLFDSNAVPIPDFPVYGSSPVDLSDLDKDEKPELVVRGAPNTLIVYRMN